MRGTRYPNAPFVIPNVVRNPVGKREEILRFALNDKLMVNGQWLIVMRGTRYPNATLCHSEHREESRLERLGVRPWASGGEPTEQRAGRKKIRLSEAKQVT